MTAEETIEIKNNTNNTISVTVGNEEEQESRGDFHDFDYEPDDISFLKTTAQIETLTKTLQPLIDALSRPEVVKALEALGKDECPDTLEGADRAMWYNNKTEREQEKQREAVVKAYKEFWANGTPYSSFTIFEAGYHAGMKRGDK